MANTTSHEAELTRTETASFLRDIADELDSNSRVRVEIGNKAVQLSPPERIGTEATVTERSRRLRKDTEELELRLKWTPTDQPIDAAADGGSESD